MRTDYKSKYSMNTENQIYQDILKISDEEVMSHSPWATHYGKGIYNKIRKEIMSERLILKYKVWRILFSGRTPRRVIDKDLQKAGVDYIIYSDIDSKSVAIDLKSSFGDYRLSESQESIAIELAQNGKPTFTEDKKTDYILYVYGNTNTLQVYFILIPYKDIVSISQTYTRENSFITDNGSGECIKVPLSVLLSTYHCTLFSSNYK